MTSAIAFPLDQAELSFTASGDALVRRSVLPCGVRILTERVPGSRSVTLGYWVAVGSRDEIPAEAAGPGHGAHPASLGSTHFLEHLLLKGTPSRTALDIAIAFDSVGGEHNAMTAKEYTCYYAKIRDTDLDMAVDVMSDMLTSSLIDPDEFETERQVILEELAMAEDDPSDVAQERFFEAVLGEHPLGRPIGGNPETIRAATRDAVVAHYRANYRPNDLVITAAGSLDHDALVARVISTLESAGWDLADPAEPVARRSTARTSIVRGAELTVVERPIEQANIMLGVPGLVVTDERRVVQTVLNSILGGGMSSRLFQEIREKRGLAYSVFSFASSYSDAGVFGLYAGTSPKKAPEVADLLLAEFHNVAENGITVDELTRAKGQLAGASALALEDTDSRMSRLGKAEISQGEFNDYDAALALLNNVTVESVGALARELAAGELSLVSVGQADADSLGRIVKAG
jgi:predicted Zn-dependent peptidase